MIVVEVLITNCQVSEKPNIGPLSAQAITSTQHRTNVSGLPVTRETAAPAWHELVPVLRKMEMRGEIRGGRFVSNVGGEQYALPAAVDMLRKRRDAQPDEKWYIISAADPLNLAGILTPGGRIPATHKNALALRDGQVLATLIAGDVEYFQPLDEAQKWELRGALSLARLQLTQNRVDQARQITASVYGRFTEGFETADLRAARTMLESL